MTVAVIDKPSDAQNRCTKSDGSGDIVELHAGNRKLVGASRASLVSTARRSGRTKFKKKSSMESNVSSNTTG